jgi:hypothetical protein
VRRFVNASHGVYLVCSRVFFVLVNLIVDLLLPLLIDPAFIGDVLMLAFIKRRSLGSLRAPLQ